MSFGSRSLKTILILKIPIDLHMIGAIARVYNWNGTETIFPISPFEIKSP